MLMWVFFPTFLGHGSLMTPDAVASALGLVAAFSFWGWLRKPSWQNAFTSGLMLGVAELSKTTFVVLYPLWFAFWIIDRKTRKIPLCTRSGASEFSMLVVRTLIALVIINTAYGYKGTFQQLGQYDFISTLFAGEIDRSIVVTGGSSEISYQTGNRFRGTMLEKLPVPFPQDYILGMDVQQRDFESDKVSYLRQQQAGSGWPWFYIYAMLIKTPIGTLGIFVFAIVIQLRRKKSREDLMNDLFLLAIAATIHLAAASKYGFTMHFRYVMPALPFLIVWSSQVGKVFASESRHLGIPHLSRVILTCLLGFPIVSSIAWFPHSLSYFNESIGSWRNSPQHLLDSNLDWGQDLLFLDEWASNLPPGEKVYAALYTLYSVGHAPSGRIQRWPQPEETRQRIGTSGGFERPEYYAASVNFLHGLRKPLYDLNGKNSHFDHLQMSRLQSMKPYAEIGATIKIFTHAQFLSALRQDAVDH